MGERWRLVYIERNTGVHVVQYLESAEEAQSESELIQMRGDILVECAPVQSPAPTRSDLRA